MSTDAFSTLSVPRLSNPGSEVILAQSKARGHSAGYAAGLRAAQKVAREQRAAHQAEHDEKMQLGRAAVERAVEALASAARAADARALPIVQESQDAIAAAAIDLAEAILGHELAHGERSARSALNRALGTVPASALTSIRMNPDDLALLEHGEAGGVELVADSSLQRGDAIAELPDGYLDARIGTALARAKAALLGERT
ncbi:MAG: FliH/SctL family protein [Microbacterium sp.]